MGFSVVEEISGLMMDLTTTEIVMSVTVVLLFGYDIYAVIKGGISNTISWQIVDLSKRFPFIPFSLGFLMGHFFGQM